MKHLSKENDSITDKNTRLQNRIKQMETDYENTYNELSKLNNELVNMHRTIAGKNEMLGKLNDSLQEEIAKRVEAERAKEETIIKLQDALTKVKTLSGLLPICAWCKKIRDDKGYWNQLEKYIGEHSDAEFTHSICPECAAKLYPEVK